MELKSLYAEYACRYDKLKIDFNKGIILINGANKSGKSSILDIITFGVFGKCQKSKKLSYFKKRGSKKPTVVVIIFDFMASLWKISRTITGNGQVAELHIDGELKASGASDVEAYLRENFVPEDLLLNSNLANQRDMSKLLHATDGGRFKIFKKIFDLIRYQFIADKVKSDIDKEDKLITSTESEIKIIEDRIRDSDKFLQETKFSDLEDLVIVKETEILDQEKMIGDNSTKIGVVTQKLETVAAQNKLIEAENQQRVDLDREVTVLENSIMEEGKSLESQKVDLISKEALQESGSRKIEEDRVKVEAIKIPRIIPFDDTSLESVLTDLGTANSDLHKEEKHLELARKGECPECEQKTDFFKEDGIILKIDILNNKISQTKVLIGKLQEDQRVSIKEKEDRDTLKVSKDTLLQSIEHQEATKILHLKTIEDLKPQIVQTEKRIINYNNLKSEKETRLSNMIEKPLVQSTELNSELGGLQEVKSSLASTLIDFKTELTQRNTAVRSYKDLEAGVSKDKLKITELKKDLVFNFTCLSNLKECREIFEKKLPLFMVIHKLNIIEKEANAFLHRIDDQFTISFKSSSKDSLSIMIYDDIDKEESPSENLSGFEETLIGLSIRWGISHFNKYLNSMPIHFFAVDEPDKSADDSNTDQLFNVLKELSLEYTQLLVITHKEFIKESLYGAQILDIVRDDKTSSTIKEIV